MCKFKKNKVVYLFGAGAMIDFGGPKTSELSMIVKNVIDNCCPKIIKFMDSCYKNVKSENKEDQDLYNFETILAVVEDLLDWQISKEIEGYRTPLNTNTIYTAFKSKEDFSSEELYQCYSEAINNIIEKVDNYDNVENEKFEKLKKLFYKEIKNQRVKIYSLNYDRVIPHLFGARINDGTVATERLCTRIFSYNIKDFTNDKFTYFNLHGSIYLKQVSNRLYKVIQSNTPEKLQFAHFIKGGSPNKQKIFSPIIAGYSKCDRVLSEPFHFGMCSFISDCATCDEMVIIGYSFGDTYINNIISNYLKTKKVTIVDYKPKDEEKESLKNSVIEVMGVFNPISSTIINDNTVIKFEGFQKYIEEQL